MYILEGLKSLNPREAEKLYPRGFKILISTGGRDAVSSRVQNPQFLERPRCYILEGLKSSYKHSQTHCFSNSLGVISSRV